MEHYGWSLDSKLNQFDTTSEMLAGDLRKIINLQPPATDMQYFFSYLLVMMEACPMSVIFVVGTIQKPPDTQWLEQKWNRK